MAAASSASERAPQTVITPPAAHKPNTTSGAATLAATPAGDRKIPEPIVMPTTIAAALQIPSVRGSVAEAVTGVSICFQPLSFAQARLAPLAVESGAGGLTGDGPHGRPGQTKAVKNRTQKAERRQDFGSWAWSV
jgi:hypothetical protein